MYPHRIRLRGPWCYAPLAGSLPTGVMRLPCRWRDGGLDEFSGKVRFTRHFGSPRRLDPYERVWLTVAGVSGSCEIDLNDKFVGHRQGIDHPVEFPITDLIRPRNTLTITVEADSNGGIWGEVALEIRAAAWLSDVTVEAWSEGENGFLRLRAAVRGEAERPLDLYAILGRSTALQAAVSAGQSFELVSEPLPPERWREERAVCVELMNGASAWCTLELPIEFRAAEKTQ